MKITFNNQLPWLSLTLLALLLVFAPHAMSFRPCPAYTTDALYFSRVVLVLLGLNATMVALFELVAVLRRRDTDFIKFSAFAAAFLACAVIGWRSYPYWVNGVYQVDIGTFPSMDQDPKGLIPMIWMGEFWRLPVVFLYLLGLFAVPALFFAIMLAVSRRRFAAAFTTAFCLIIVSIFMTRFSPNYGTWLMD